MTLVSNVVVDAFTDTRLWVGVKETQYMMDKVTGLHGFFGASSMERLPVETAIQQNTEAFKSIKIRGQ